MSLGDAFLFLILKFYKISESTALQVSVFCLLLWCVRISATCWVGQFCACTGYPLHLPGIGPHSLFVIPTELTRLGRLETPSCNSHNRQRRSVAFLAFLKWADKFDVCLFIYILFRKLLRPPLWSSAQSFWLQIQRSLIRFPALPDFLRSMWSGTGSTQPRENNWGTTWMKK
jgi:hypothetical protein